MVQCASLWSSKASTLFMLGDPGDSGGGAGGVAKLEVGEVGSGCSGCSESGLCNRMTAMRAWVSGDCLLAEVQLPSFLHTKLKVATIACENFKASASLMAGACTSTTACCNNLLEIRFVRAEQCRKKGKYEATTYSKSLLWMFVDEELAGICTCNAST